MRGSENGNRYSPTGTSILTWSGQSVELTAPDPATIRIEDIAAGLAHQERFTGQCPLRPTIAQHSLAVRYIATELFARANNTQAVPPRLARAALMHDAAEAYVGDCSGAVKLLMRRAHSMSDFDCTEARLQNVINTRYDCDPDGYEELIHEADCLACSYEMSIGDWEPTATLPTWLRRDARLGVMYDTDGFNYEDGGFYKFRLAAAGLGMQDA
jgi:hypothetical protein